MRYALLVYGNEEVVARTPDAERERIGAQVDEVCRRPDVTGLMRLQGVDSARTVRLDQGRALVSDGPFVDSKDFLGGLIVVEADDLDGAIALARELRLLELGGGIEIRPIREEGPIGA
jgi:hypothetical protein